MNFKKKIGKVFTSKFVGTGPSSYKKRIYRAAVSQKLRNTGLECEKWQSWKEAGSISRTLILPIFWWQWEEQQQRAVGYR